MGFAKIGITFFLVGLLAACGGGGSSSSSTTALIDTSSAYTGNRGLAALTASNSSEFLQLLFAGDSLSEVVASRPASRPQQKAVYDSGSCSSGSADITGDINETTGTGELAIRFNNCVNNGTTLNGNAAYIIHSVNQYTEASTFNLKGLSVTAAGASYTLTGTQRMDVDMRNGTRTTLTSNVYGLNNTTGKEILLQNLQMVARGNKANSFSGTMCLQVHGCVTVTTSNNFKLGSDGLPETGTLTFTGLSGATAQTVYAVDPQTQWRQFILNVDADGNNSYEYTSAPNNVKTLSGRANTPPVAVIKGSPYLIELSAYITGLQSTPLYHESYDPDGDSIAITWALISAPPRSKAAIRQEYSSFNQLDCDLQGEYKVSLTVTDEYGASNQQIVTFDAQRYNSTPHATIEAPDKVAIGATITLDGKNSADGNEDALTFKWSIQSAPIGSTARLLNTSNKQTSLTLNVAGTYVFSLEVDDGYRNGKNVITKEIHVADIDFSALAHDAVDVEYSDSLDKMIMVSAKPANKLYIISPSHGTEQSVTLALAPTSVSVSPDGKSAVVGHDGGVTLINLETRETLAKHLRIGIEVADIALSNNQKAYAFDAADAWMTPLYEINLVTGEKIPHLEQADDSPAFSRSLVKLQPKSNSLYTLDYILGKYDVSSTPPKYLYESAQNSPYSMGDNLWFSDDGEFILTEAGTLFQTASTPARDMGYVRSLPAADYLSADHSAKAGQFVMVTNPDFFDGHYTLETYNVPLLTLAKTQTFEGVSLDGSPSLPEPAVVFFNAAGTASYLVMKQGERTYVVRH